MCDCMIMLHYNLLLLFLQNTIFSVILNDKSMVSFLEDNWDDLSSQMLDYPRSRTDLTKRIKKFYLSAKDYEFSEGNNSSTVPPHTHQPLPPQPPQPPASLSIPSHINPATNRTTPFVPHTVLIPSSTPATTTTTTSRYAVYQDDQDITINFEEQFKSFTNLFTDRYFIWPLFETIRLQASESRIYAYENMYEGQHTMLDVYTGKSKEPAPAMKKVKNWFKTNILGRKVQAPKHLGKMHDAMHLCSCRDAVDK